MSRIFLKIALSGFICVILVVEKGFSQVPRALPQPYAPSAVKNYIRVWDVVKPESDGASLDLNTSVQVSQINTQYMDGLGRAFQKVTKAATPIGKDLTVAIDYDELGRQQYQYLPFAASNADGNFKINPFQQHATFYNSQLSGQVGETNVGPDNSTWAYNQFEFEQTPESRLLNSFAPGLSWVGNSRGSQNKYWTNTLADDVKIWSVTNGVSGTFGTYQVDGVYLAGQLFKSVTVDEHGKQLIQFSDKKGRLILKKVQNNTAIADDGSGTGYLNWLTSYYIYDDKDLLRCVIQPVGVENLIGSWSLGQILLDNQCFRYEYDERNRMVMKKIPGAGEILMVYDARDRLVLSQDANLRNPSPGVPVRWIYTLYDNLNRPVTEGLWSDGQSQTFHANQAKLIINYPNLNGQTHEELKSIFYDNYDWIATNGFLISGNMDVNVQSWLLPATTTFPYTQASIQSKNVTGRITGTVDKILGTSNSIGTCFIYNSEGQIIQTQANNIFGDLDVVTFQYNFDGKVARNYVRHQTGGGTNKHHIVTSMEYDNIGRLKKIFKTLNFSINGSSIIKADHPIVQYDYDELGQVKVKKLGENPRISGSQLTDLDYEYNVRGWLLSLNKSYLSTVSTGKYFGMELGYDKSGSISNFTPVYNGNIAGVLWKSEGDQEVRKYDFSYDEVSRLKLASFSQPNNASANIDFGISNLSYDANGNIKTMNQAGLKLNQSPLIDQLTYSYENYGLSNKLQQVTDLANDQASKLGDFKYDPGTKTNTDFTYDANGNLISDNNKNITKIQYNHLNLPEIITTNKGTVSYQYDTRGTKLSKTVQENGVSVYFNGSNYPTSITTTTLYVLGLIYESKLYSNPALATKQYSNVIQFIQHEEGRVRFELATNISCTPLPDRFVFDYFIKDHLGNVRSVLTEQLEDYCYPTASVEDATYLTEGEFYSIDNNRRESVSSTTASQSSFGSKFYQTHGNLAGRNTGLGLTLKVMAGDQVKIAAESFYELPSGNAGSPVPILLADLVSAFLGSADLIANKGVISASSLESIGDNLSEFTNFIGRTTPTPASPKAYLNWILFDEQLNFVVADADPIEDFTLGNGYTFHDKFVNNFVNVSKSGYLYVFVSNESNLPVFFDNLAITHTPGPLIEETHYYPFGLIQAGISSKASGNAPVNKAKFNGIEHNNDFDLNIYDAFYRNLDPQVGRFWQIDPKPNEAVSPYVAMLNNPIRFSDPLGDTTWLYNQNGVFMGVINNKKSENQVHFIKTDGDPGQVVNFDKFSKKDQRAYEKKFREVSIAFLGSKTAAEMKSIVDKSVRAGVEIGFVGVIGEGKQISLIELPIDAGNKIDQVPNGPQIDANYSSSEQKSNLFLEGHTHIKAYLEALKDPTMMKSYLKNGLPNQSPSKPDDYTPVLDRSNGKGAAPSMVITPFGVTLYGAGHMTPWGQPSPNNTYLNYKSLK